MAVLWLFIYFVCLEVALLEEEAPRSIPSLKLMVCLDLWGELVVLHLVCLGEGGPLVQQGVFHSPDILSHRLVVVCRESELVQLAGAQLAQLQ